MSHKKIDDWFAILKPYKTNIKLAYRNNQLKIQSMTKLKLQQKLVFLCRDLNFRVEIHQALLA
jgi:hypothetical protein